MSLCEGLSLSVAATGYTAFNAYFRNNFETTQDTDGKESAVSTCELACRVIVAEFAYALIQVVALVETVVRLALAVPVFIFGLLNACIGCLDGSDYEKYIMNPTLGGGMAGLAFTIGLFTAHYFNMTQLKAASAPKLLTTTFPCLPSFNPPQQRV